MKTLNRIAAAIIEIILYCSYLGVVGAILGLMMLLAGKPPTATMNFDRTTVELAVNLLGIPALKWALKCLRAARIAA